MRARSSVAWARSTVPSMRAPTIVTPECGTRSLQAGFVMTSIRKAAGSRRHASVQRASSAARASSAGVVSQRRLKSAGLPSRIRAQAQPSAVVSSS